MIPKQRGNVPASIKARLLNRARADQQDFNLYLIRYATERLLYRLSVSPHAGDFILKGAMLFVVWSDLLLRPTMDLDLLGLGEDSIERFERVFRDLANLQVEQDDGISFDADSVRAIAIRDEQEYQGKRVTMKAQLGNVPIKVQVDIGIGDIVTPSPEALMFPGLLDLPQARIRGSTRDTVVAEKLHVMITRGLLNSRLKDYFDILVLSQRFAFTAPMLRAAIVATFGRRRTEVPTAMPVALTARYVQEAGRSQAWNRLTTKTAVNGTSLENAIIAIASFLDPVISQPGFPGRWPASGPWSTKT